LEGEVEPAPDDFNQCWPHGIYAFTGETTRGPARRSSLDAVKSAPMAPLAATRALP
jgi:hypothetical protein